MIAKSAAGGSGVHLKIPPSRAAAPTVTALIARIPTARRAPARSPRKLLLVADDRSNLLVDVRKSLEREELLGGNEL
jgi:hypothetical protein